MATILCFGDSNTWGCPPFSHVAQKPERLARTERWPGVMEQALGNAEVVEEGLGGRTTVFDDAIEGIHKNGSRMIVPLLETHAPLDVVIIMLGTNDFKEQYNVSAYTSVRGSLTIVQMIKGHYALAESMPEILLVTPARISAAAEPAVWGDAHLRCEDHAYYLDQVASRTGCFHFDANSVVQVGEDGIHLPASAHRALGLALADRVQALLTLRATS
jgi:lysophospholipase L1-like esterase